MQTKEKASTILRLIRILGFIFTLAIWSWVLNYRFNQWQGLVVVMGTVSAVFPVVWVGRKMLDTKPTTERTAWATTVVHLFLMVFFGSAIIEAIKVFQVWPGWIVPLPTEIGLGLLILTSLCALLTVINLALSGLGAPFAVALSKKLATNWMYSWTRNPMVLSTLASLIAAGLYLRSLWFLLWVIILVTPAWLYFIKVYEERELEIRFGTSYSEYKTKTPMLWPRRPRQ